jgi:preprotein translocase subunit SecA
MEHRLYPSFTLQVMLNHVLKSELGSRQAAQQALLELATEALEAETEHILRTADNLLFQAQDRLEMILAERMESVDLFFEGLALEDETDTRSPRELLNELSSLVRMPLRFSNQEQRLLRDDPDEAEEMVRAQLEQALFMQAILRLLGAVQRRLPEDLDLTASDLADLEWDTVTDRVLEIIEKAYDRRQERLIGANGEGLIARDLANALEKVTGNLTEDQILRLLLLMTQGSRATFDRKTHRRVWQRTTRLTYSYSAARFIDNQDPNDLAEEVLLHLEAAQETIRQAWGFSELARLGAISPNELNSKTRRGLDNAVGEEVMAPLGAVALEEITGEVRDQIVDELGRQAITEVYRQLLLNVISELWVDFLTQMESLRVSIGLEAYAQRDPLVQYKSRAFEMFRKLLTDMRISVVSRMFTFRPRATRAIQAETKQSDDPAAIPETTGGEPGAEERPTSKRKRRRRRRK